LERKFTDDPRDAEIADNVLQNMRHSLQMLASPAQAQLSHFPAGWIVLTDELVLDFDAWYVRIYSYWELSVEQIASLMNLDEFLNTMSVESNSDFWTDGALSSDHRWERVRNLAKLALISLEWPLEIPPPAREENGMIVDYGAYFIKSDNSDKSSEK
jgi:hypothetical protein